MDGVRTFEAQRGPNVQLIPAETLDIPGGMYGTFYRFGGAAKNGVPGENEGISRLLWILWYRTVSETASLTIFC